MAKHMCMLKHPIPRFPPLSCYNVLHSSGKTFHQFIQLQLFLELYCESLGKNHTVRGAHTFGLIAHCSRKIAPNQPMP